MELVECCTVLRIMVAGRGTKDFLLHPICPDPLLTFIAATTQGCRKTDDWPWGVESTNRLNVSPETRPIIVAELSRYGSWWCYYLADC